MYSLNLHLKSYIRAVTRSTIHQMLYERNSTKLGMNATHNTFNKNKIQNFKKYSAIQIAIVKSIILVKCHILAEIFLEFPMAVIEI